MKITRINNTLPYIKKPLKPIVKKKDDLMQRCSDVRHKGVKNLTVKDIPYAAAIVGLFTPLPFGWLIGYGVGKVIELTVNKFKKKSD